jgi:hypothetical protein
MTDTSAILHLAAKKLGTRVKKVNCYDANVCDAEFSPETKWQAKVLSGHPFSQEVRVTYRDRRVHVMGNPDYIRCTVYGQLDMELCSINRPNKVSFVDRPSPLCVAGDPRWPVFQCAGKQPSEKLRRFLGDPKFHKTAQKVIRDSSESLHLFKDAIELYTKPTSVDAVIDAIDALSSLVGPHVSETLSVDFAVLPASLHGLIPLIKRWAVTDDGEREALLAEASESELSDLVATVEPRLGEIDDYLQDSADESLPAIYIGALAECTVEARLSLERLREGK